MLRHFHPLPARHLRVDIRNLVHLARSAVPDVAGPLRMAWFRVKRALGVSTRSDRVFLVSEFVRHLGAGHIGRQCHIAVSERSDGAGAQALAKMSAICLAHAHGLTNVHVPFRTMAHAEGSPQTWGATWERMLGLGRGEISVDQCRLPQVGIEQFMADRRWWSTPCVLAARHFHPFTDRTPDAYLGVIPHLRARYQIENPPRARSAVVEVCAHLRRGDVAADDPETAGRFTSGAAMLRTIEQVGATLKALQLPFRVRLFSQGVESDFAMFRQAGCELQVNLSAMDTFKELVAADILVMSPSSFSYSAAILNDGTKIYARYSRPPLSHWIVRSEDGGFDAARMHDMLAARRFLILAHAAQPILPSAGLGRAR